MTDYEAMISNVKSRGILAHEHQYAGVKWCLKQEIEGFKSAGREVRGGILADEMGLGKTYQMMGLIASNFVNRTLVVLPRSLLEQWEGAIKKALGHQALVYHGKGVRVNLDQLSKAPIVLTTYGMLVETKRHGFRAVHDLEWGRVIFDEAHHLRNRGTRVHKGAIALRAKRRWLVTGTPIQNSKSDYWALCAAMGLDAEFYQDVNNLVKIARGCILKRTLKDAGIFLPELRRHEVRVPWASREEQALAEEVHALLAFSGVDGTGERKPMLDGAAMPNQLAALTKARQCCTHPRLLDLQRLVDAGVAEDTEVLRRALIQRSKLDGVVKKVTERDNGRSKILFCHYRGEIDALEADFKRLGKTVSVLDGRTGGQEARNAILNSKSDVLIMQYQTGCEGLNLQQYTEVYFVSPHWNPAVEDQAVARAWRIGQTEEVDVFRFEMSSFDEEGETRTVDKYVKDVHRKKREIMVMIDEAAEEDKPIGAECSICYEGITKHTCARLPCGHTFHRACSNTWLNRNPTCPVCRKRV